ncbi:MAG: ParB/RepB/Spo0J family partition protein [Bacteroidetes bacterium]|nr:ParB/RepB/Spo0J family partition protein [Bacteroidota bacterium]MBL0033860.1 ParB/RepB/Spo0J family partition protein [Bacteroidota bacterium]MBP6428589.1 ParB/RepB/Spo0J family partition protein [Bacteroidia bacterium]MBP6656517.1 ParB/RepB/Spo0J family partition protein [Bacteroidia bacterium]
MTIKKSALGKGLSALLESSDSDVTSNVNSAATGGVVGSIAQLPLEQIEPNPFQPRVDFDDTALGELSTSIKEQGIIQPITVRKLGYDKYQIISGERRYKASKLAGLKTIPAYIRVANDQGMLEMAIVENIQREDLNALEVALSYKRLIDECGLTQEELSERLGKNRSTVTNFLRLLKLPPDIQASVRDGKISMGHARAILGVDDIDKQLYIYREILNKNLSVRDVELLARETGNKSTIKKKKDEMKDQLSFEFSKIQNILTSHFGAKIQLQRANNGSGKIVIPFQNDEDLNRVLELLNY